MMMMMMMMMMAVLVVVVIIGTLDSDDDDASEDVRQKTIVLIRKTLALHVRFTFWYISLSSSAKQQREMTTFKVLWRTWAHNGECFIFFFNLNATPTNLVPG